MYLGSLDTSFLIAYAVAMFFRYELAAHLYARNGADHHSCTGGTRITTEGGSFKRDLRAGSVCPYVCMYVCMSVRHAPYCDVA